MWFMLYTQTKLKVKRICSISVWDVIGTKRKENINQKAKWFFQIASADKVKTTIILHAIVYCVSAAMLPVQDVNVVKP